MSYELKLNLTDRFRGIFNPDDNPFSIALIGAGSIGSNLALLLARLGITDLTVYDYDLVEDHNLGHQAYRVSDIGKPKVEALKELIALATGTEIKIVNSKLDKTNPIKADILIIGVDTMEARKEIYGAAEFSFLLDGRMGGETFNVYAISSLSKERYEKTLYSDEEASELPCGGRSIGYISYLIAGIMENTLKKMIKGEDFPFEQNFCARNLIYQLSN
mgnify:CR=1 FL=1